MFRPRSARTIAPLFARRIVRAPARRSFRKKAERETAVENHFAIHHNFTWKNVLTPFIYAGTAYAVVVLIKSTFFPNLDKKWAEAVDAVESLRKDEVEEEWDDEDNWFLPLNPWPSVRPRQYYKGSDPEWLAFITFSKDEKKQKKIKEQFAALIRGKVSRNRNAKKFLGQVDLNRGAFWVDIIFPSGPPLEYERYGIELGREGFSLTTQPVTDLNRERFNAALWPAAVFHGLLQAGKHTLKLQYDHIRGRLGISDAEEQSPTPTAQDVIKRLANPSGDAPGTSQRTEPAPAKTVSAQSSQPASSKERGLAKFELVPGAMEEPTSMVGTFLTTFVGKRRPYNIEPPRGAIMLKGMVSVQGDKGRMSVMVMGCYDLKADKFLSVDLNVVTAQPKSQQARGGP